MAEESGSEEVLSQDEIDDLLHGVGEGTDDGTELCDDCWASRFDGAKVAI